ncbi:MAG: hypothetical protein KME30_18170 [Iphinoe sp. HA4291-MV1]|jgi:hypothetical protein|nr:hypothetical protein [Iphinoe sp. HA4291-MV1]
MDNTADIKEKIIGALADSTFYTNKELDFRVVTLKNVPDLGKPLIFLEPSTQRRHLRNAGTSAVALLNDLRNNAPEIYTSLAI